MVSVLNTGASLNPTVGRMLPSMHKWATIGPSEKEGLNGWGGGGGGSGIHYSLKI